MSPAQPGSAPDGRAHGEVPARGHSHMKAYVSVFVALLVLTGVTVLASEQDFGLLNTVVAIGIAVVKASLVGLYFMHVRWSERLVWIFAGVGALFIVLLIAGTMQDYVTRDWMPIYGPAEPVR